MTVSVGELQKNISMLNDIKEPIIVIDKRSKKQIAKIEPIKDNDLDLLEELLKDDIVLDKDIVGKENFEEIYSEYLSEKYSHN